MAKKQMSAGEKIFKNLYRVRISNAIAESKFGKTFKASCVVTDPNDYHDYLGETTTVLRTINNVIEHYRLGTIVSFENSKDIGEVYEILSQHLTDWDEFLKQPVRYQAPPPAEDMFLIQTYMESIYEEAMQVLGSKYAKENLELRKNDGDNFFAAFGGGLAFKPTEHPDMADFKGGDKVAKPGDFFIDMVNNRGH